MAFKLAAPSPNPRLGRYPTGHNPTPPQPHVLCSNVLPSVNPKATPPQPKSQDVSPILQIMLSQPFPLRSMALCAASSLTPATPPRSIAPAISLHAFRPHLKCLTTNQSPVFLGALCSRRGREPWTSNPWRTRRDPFIQTAPLLDGQAKYQGQHRCICTRRKQHQVHARLIRYSRVMVLNSADSY
jgi:hypothetical protein